MHQKNLISTSRKWLSNDVFPLWSQEGIDPRNGSFVESLTLEGKAMSQPKRAMVQARQIYSFAEAARMEILPAEQVRKILRPATEFFIARYSLPNGSFVHAVDPDGKVANPKTDLYAQAFAMFGLASAYEMLGDTNIKDRAKQLLAYLRSERALQNGGYSEFEGDQIAFEANPHMHLFEAAIAWMRVDKDPEWSEFAAELNEMCRAKFIDPETGALAEHHSSDWKPLRESEGFVWEPGHHFEWAWLMLQYAEASGTPPGSAPLQLYRLADRFGVDEKTGFAMDEIWSSKKAKKRSSRFWPQSERVKAAVSLGALVTPAEQPAFARAADQALQHLFLYFEGVKPGLWVDTRSASGEFVNQPVKASSLYHIINAISEYSRKRPALEKSV